LPVEEIRSATRSAFDNLVQKAIDEAVDFVIIAGDLFDGDWKDMGTGSISRARWGDCTKRKFRWFVLAGNTTPRPSSRALCLGRPTCGCSQASDPRRTAARSVSRRSRPEFRDPAVTENLGSPTRRPTPRL
jgi:hypothetical protein